MGNRLSSRAEDTHIAEILQSLRTKDEAKTFSDYTLFNAIHCIGQTKRLKNLCHASLCDKSICDKITCDEPTGGKTDRVKSICNKTTGNETTGIELFCNFKRMTLSGVVSPKCLKYHISITVLSRHVVIIDHPQQTVHRDSNGHVTADIT